MNAHLIPSMLRSAVCHLRELSCDVSVNKEIVIPGFHCLLCSYFSVRNLSRACRSLGPHALLFATHSMLL